jgi:hypothetical protein
MRRLRNIAPDFSVEFVASKGGVAFRLKDKAGRYRSRIVNVYRKKSGHALDRSHLEWLLKRAGFPGVMPR